MSDKNKIAALSSDIGLLQTSDGVLMLDLWNRTLVPALADYNAQFNLLVNFMAYKTDEKVEQVTQAIGEPWQEATAEGLTKGMSKTEIQTFGIRTAFREYQSYIGFTRKFIEKYTAAKLVQMYDAGLKALTDQKYVKVLEALYLKGKRALPDPDTHETVFIRSLVDGSNDMPIPRNGVNVFNSGHSHFHAFDASNASWTDPVKREAAVKAVLRNISEHGYRDKLVILAQGSVLDDLCACPSFRGFVDLSPFAQSSGAALDGNGDRQQATLSGIKPTIAGIFRVAGTILNATIFEGDMLPLNYFAAFSWQGPNSAENPVQWMETPVRSWSDAPYAFYESMFQTGMGAGIRKRLNGAVAYVAPGAAAYTNPTSYVTAGDMVGEGDFTD